MKAVFVADAHLKGTDDPNQALFCKFLEDIKGIDKLIILGDIFDFWMGDNKFLRDRHAPVLTKLLDVKRSGTKITYIEGNHDFCLGRYFLDTLNADVYATSADLLMDGNRIFLAHGDTVNMSTAYRIWRWFIRSPFNIILIKFLPPALVWRVAMALSRTSRRNIESSRYINNLLKRVASDKIKEGFDFVIMGHSHIADISQESINGKTGIYANPGDWITDHDYLIYNDGGFKLKRYAG